MTRKLRSLLTRPGIAVIAAMTIYTILICWTCHAKYTTFAYDDFDLAIDAQATWNILHGSLESSIHRIVFLGNHMRIVLFLLAPLYAVFQSPLFFLYLQTLALAASALGIYLIARRHVPSSWSALLSIAFLLYTPLINLNLYEFHPVALAIPALIFMFLFYELKHFAGFTTCMALALSCQENISLIIAAFGIYALLDKRKGKWAIAPLCAGIIYFIAAFLIIIPHFNENTIQFYRLYGDFGNSMPEIIRYALLHPVEIARRMATTRNISYVNSLVSPLGYLPLAGPLQFIPALPALGQRLLSARASETTIMFHYQAEFIPFVFIATVFGLKRLLALKHRYKTIVASVLLTLFPLMSLCMSGVIPRCFQHIRNAGQVDPQREVKESVVTHMPEDAAVLASFEFLPELSSRRSLYSLHHVYSGHYTLSDVPYPDPTNITHIILNTQDRLTFSPEGYYRKDGHKNLQRILAKGKWTVLENTCGILALKRGETNEAGNLTHQSPLPSSAATNIVQSPDAGLQLQGFQITSRTKASSADLILYWIKTEEQERDYNTSLTIEGCDGSAIYQGRFAPGSRISPPQSWPTGVTMADHHGIPYSKEVSPGSVRITVSLTPLPGP